MGAMTLFFSLFFFGAPAPPGAPTGAQGPRKGAATRRVVDDRALERARRPRGRPRGTARRVTTVGTRSGAPPALAHAPGGSPGTPWTLRGPRRKKKKCIKGYIARGVKINPGLLYTSQRFES